MSKIGGHVLETPSRYQKVAVSDFGKVTFLSTAQKLTGVPREVHNPHRSISNQHIAESIFDFAVNAGPVTSTKLAQITVNGEPDGVIMSLATSGSADKSKTINAITKCR